jgi:hypothetical protein
VATETIVEGGTHSVTHSDHLAVLILVGSLPTWPYSSGWGFYPSGGAGLVLLVLIVLLLSGRL